MITLLILLHALIVILLTTWKTLTLPYHFSKENVWVHKTSLTHICYWSAFAKPVKWAVMYLYARVIDVAFVSKIVSFERYERILSYVSWKE